MVAAILLTINVWFVGAAEYTPAENTPEWYAYNYFASGAGSNVSAAPAVENYIWVDLRPETEYLTGHVKGAYNIPFGPDLAANLKYLKYLSESQNKQIVVYSKDGQISNQALALLNVAFKKVGAANKAAEYVLGLGNGYVTFISNASNASKTETARNNLPKNNESPLDPAFQTAANNYFKNWNGLSADFKDYNVSHAKTWEVSANLDSDYILVALPASSGTLAGQRRIAYATLEGIQDFTKLPKNKKILISCGSGQTSAISTAVMKLLGYDAYSVEGGWGGAYLEGGNHAPSYRNYAESKTPNIILNTTGGGNSPISSTGVHNNVQAKVEVYYDTLPYGISAADALAKVGGNDALFIDVRSESEYNAGHIAGAVNLPFGTAISDHIGKIHAQSAGKTVIVYSGDGQISFLVAPLLKFLDIDAKILGGGWANIAKDPANASKISTSPSTLAASATTFTGNPLLIKESIDRYFYALAFREGTQFANYNVSIDSLKSILAGNLDNYVFLDVRPASAYAAGRITDRAINIPTDASRGYYANISDFKNALAGEAQYKKIIVNCGVGMSSSQAVAVLRSLGYDAYTVTGGYSAWLASFGDDSSSGSDDNSNNSDNSNSSSDTTPSGGGNTDSGDLNPDTGDNTEIAASLTIIVISAAALMLITLKKRKTSN